MHIKQLPQRFRFTRRDCREWLYGVAAEIYCGSDGYRWRVEWYEIDDTDIGQPFDCCDADEDPTPHIRKRLGNATDFEWLDHDGGWPDE